MSVRVPARRLYFLRCVLLVFASCAMLRAQTTPAQTTTATRPPAENPEEFSRVRGLFDVDLPRTVEKFHAKVIVHPHFGDFLHRGYVRVPVGVRLGLSDRTEISTEVESYLT